MSSAAPSEVADPIETELEAIARDCHLLARRLASLAPATISTAKRPHVSLSRLSQVRRYLRARRLRERLFPADLFADPAWDMLLDLYASELEEQAVSISSACVASAVPATTALRWLGRLEQLGLIERSDDKNDNRRTFVRLTPTTRAAVERWLEQAPLIAGVE